MFWSRYLALRLFVHLLGILSFPGNAFYGERDGIERSFVQFLSVKDGHVLRALLENLYVRVHVLF